MSYKITTSIICALCLLYFAPHAKAMQSFEYDVEFLSSDGALVSQKKISLPFDTIHSITQLDLGNDGTSELLIGSPPGEVGKVFLIRLDGSIINSWNAYDENFLGGVNVAAGDLDSDSYPEIVTAPASMGGPHVRIFDGFGIPKINPGFFADELDYRLGVYISIKKFEQEGVPSISTIIKKEEQNIFKIFTPDGNLIRSYPVKEEENLSESIIIPIQLNNQALQLRLPKQTRAIDSNEKTIIIDLSDQKFSYYENGFRVNTFKTSTGGSGYKTPVGEYKILNKIDLAYSRAYGLYMPYWMQFTARGHGIHELPYWPSGHREGKNHLGTAVSHGCVRLGIGSAEEVYEWAQINTTVIVQE